MANAIGSGIGFLIPQFYISDGNYVKGEVKPIFDLMLAEAILATVVLIPSFILFKNKPPTPPR